MTKEEALEKLSRSKFRSGFHLSQEDILYIRDKGMDRIRAHAEDFVRTKLSPAFPENDGKQTPMTGHPVFKAMHACACCCRGCLSKWYHVAPGYELTPTQQEKIVNFLMYWIEKQMDAAHFS